MKKHVLLLLSIFLSITLLAQEKGSYLSVSAGFGPTGYKYNIQGVNDFATPKNEIKLGGQASIGYSYFFTKHFGISTGIGLSHYRTFGKLLGEFGDFSEHGINFNGFQLGNFKDNDPVYGHSYDLRIRTQNLMEYQSGKFIEVPLLLNLQKKFGAKEYFGVFLNLGCKFQIPVSTTYSIMDEDAKKSQQAGLNVYGYYRDGGLYAGRYDHPDLSQHGFGVINNPSKVLTDAKGKLDYKFNISLVGEAGFLISLSRRVDIPIGFYVDYGVMNLKRNNEDKELFTAPGSDYIIGAENNVGKGIKYNSLTATDYVKKVNTISYGGKIGIRIKLGKLSKREEPESLLAAPVAPVRDTVYVFMYDRAYIDSLVSEIFNALKTAPRIEDPIAKPVENDKYVQKYQYNVDPVEYDYIYDKNDFTEEEIKVLLEPIYFDLNKHILRAESMTILNKKIVVMNKYPDIKLVIFGNTCDIGRDEYNYMLGEKRAEAARKYLVMKGISPERLIIRSLSKFEPQLPNTDEFNRSHNRRDDFRPLFPKKKMMMW